MTTEEWVEWHAARWAELPDKVKKDAVALVRRTFSADALADLRTRIAENPTGWLMGRKEATCALCDGSGLRHTAEHEQPDGYVDAVCPWCDGRGHAPEMPLHHGWGTGVRNLLRRAAPDNELPSGNWDDYYAQVIEHAVEEDHAHRG